jgi:3-methyladenine DNA glycosylase AlkD
MTLKWTLDALAEMGTEQNRKIYSRHGAGYNTFGVSFANLRAMAKKIKTNHALAIELWNSGNTDAMTLATMVADPKQATTAQLDRWMGDVPYYMLASLVSGFVAKTDHAEVKRVEWRKSDFDFTSQAAWELVAHAAMSDPTLNDEYFVGLLEEIEGGIHAAPNRTRHAMNAAVIAIALRNPGLKRRALAAAKRIGKVEVDHGETGCVTPDIAAYVKKTEDWRSKRQKARGA